MTERSRIIFWQQAWPFLRDVILFTAGIGGVTVLTVMWVAADREPNPSLMLLFTAMMGLPVFLRKDET